MEVFLVTRPQALKQAHIKCFFVILEQVLLETLSIESVEGSLLVDAPKWVNKGK